MSATPLAALLAERIRAQGPLRVAEYMALALHHPAHGYYARRDPLGRAGDFVTAPEISALFGTLVGLWAVAVWEAMGRPAPTALVELGPGRGTLLADACRAIERAAPAFAAVLHLHLVEASPLLRDRQRAALAALADRCQWHADFAGVPPGAMILIANEFFDALPVDQYQRTAEGWRPRLIALDPATGGPCFALGAPMPLPALDDALAAAPEGALVELCPAGEALAGAIAARVVRDGGAALVVDYGHARSAPGETLQAVRAHGFADVLAAPGEVDLSHHVDFAALVRAARAAGAQVAGPIPQGLFLARLGAGVCAERAAAEAPERAAAIFGAARRLLHPGRMGLLFKALAVSDPRLPIPPGFVAIERG